MLRYLTKTKKRPEAMTDSIDVHDLTDEDVKKVQAFIAALRAKSGHRKFKFGWEGGLARLAKGMRSVELQHKSSEWR
jgi:hypothetical protein